MENATSSSLSMSVEATPCDGCDQVCCRCFPLPKSPWALQEMADMDPPHADATYALKNFIYLGEFVYNPLYPWRTAQRRHSVHWYSCKNISWTGRCQDYDNRPELCRDYGVTYRPDVGCAMRPVYDKEHTEECDFQSNCKVVSKVRGCRCEDKVVPKEEKTPVEEVVLSEADRQITAIAANFFKTTLTVKHSELGRPTEYAPWRRKCPACSRGLLLVARSSVSPYELCELDLCIACGQHVIYEDIDSMRNDDKATRR